MIGACLYMLGKSEEFSDDEWKGTRQNLGTFIQNNLRDYKKENNTFFDLTGLGYNFRTDLHVFQDAVENYFFEIHPFQEVGTTRRELDPVGKTKKGSRSGDYDMTLVYLANFLYTFKDMKMKTPYGGKNEDGYLLTNEMIYQAISQEYRGPANQLNIPGWTSVAEGLPGIINYNGEPAPFTFSMNDYFRTKQRVCVEGVDGLNVYDDRGFKKLVALMPCESESWYNAESENHVLLEYTWNYLISNWIMWQGSLKEGDERYDPRITAILKDKNIDDFLQNDYAWWLDRMLQIVGRTVHNGLFESNARPYQTIYLNALLTLAAHADNPSILPFSGQKSGSMPNFENDQKRVALGAKNALYAIAAKFAFQSFEGKRCPPMRREEGRKFSAGFYQSDKLVDIFGALTGAYVFSPCRYYYSDIYHTGTDAFWAVITEGNLPKVPIPHAIHDFMLNKHGGYFSRMMDYYTGGHYQMGEELASDLGSPKYFIQDNNGKMIPYRGEDFKGNPELYFCTDDYLLSAGGKFRHFFDLHSGDIKTLEIWLNLWEVEQAARVYDFFSKPTIVITKGDIGGKNWETGEGDRYLNVDSAQEEVLLLLGDSGGSKDVSSGFAFSNNLWVYKNFVYGYEHKEDATEGYSKEWPQRYPKNWNQFIYNSNDPVFQIGAGGSFKVFDFTTLEARNQALSGYYVVMGRYIKDSDEEQFTEFRRGFVEIVPGRLYPTPAELVQNITQRNTSIKDNFNLAPSKSVYYVTSTTNERLKLCPVLGAYERGGCKFGCIYHWDSSRQGIQEVAKQGPNGNWEKVSLEKDYIDFNELKSIPLITVWAQNLGREGEGMENYLYAENPESGTILIRNPYIGCSSDPIENAFIKIDSKDYRNPKFETFGEGCFVDLYLEEISILSPSPLTAGKPVDLRLQIIFEGNISVMTKGVVAVEGTGIRNEFNIPRLYPSKTGQDTMVFYNTSVTIPQSGDFNITVTIDDPNIVLENDELNNSRKFAVKINPSPPIQCLDIMSCPDLLAIPHKMAVPDKRGKSYIKVEKDKLLVIVKNEGGKPAGSFITNLRFDNRFLFFNINRYSENITIDQLASGEQTVIGFPMPKESILSQKGGKFTLTVDARDMVREFKEDNNKVQTLFVGR
ncbi:MAG: hypothetical protein IPL49_21155 [Saprospirales bacterium]|nr:hypothetical protein [Saprospirales bacterium]